MYLSIYLSIYIYIYIYIYINVAFANSLCIGQLPYYSKFGVLHKVMSFFPKMNAG